ncbi:hypothetical protein Aab01nite_81750 [Paractinoplanes abujensis]|uniref:Amino acid transporter n=1 Tax=Paractinoplanes abujensis TaxID=882441 RepID=A0A7W7CUS8_9ACTN|nr:hypothetical protein [Actinoplanes abujensis]MBB4693381.1 amino acid transporter [Actinoplanes abujensis]GID24585.1 hypothetical protein Aab01nite_81750 [Actinoplanes abujensis]
MSVGGAIMYDNSSSLSLAGTGVTVLGQSAGLLVLTVAGLLFLVLACVLAFAERRSRRDPAA